MPKGCIDGSVATHGYKEFPLSLFCSWEKDWLESIQFYPEPYLNEDWCSQELDTNRVAF